MRVLINSGKGNVDYTRHVIDGTLTIEDSINVPTLITFQMSPADNSFVVPKRSSYVTIVSDVYNPDTNTNVPNGEIGGGYGSGKILGTGFITQEPERQYLGLSGRLGPFKYLQYTYTIQVTSDEWLLNCKSVPYIPAFVNQTDSQILASLAQALMPGFFNTSLMATGSLVPFYQYDPAQTWSDIAKSFADAYRYHYKVINRQIIYQPFGDQSLGISYDENVQKESQLSPSELTTHVVSVPPVNDCIVTGATEPQTNWDDYFVGDGFSSNFPTRHQVFQGVTSNLLQDDWTETNIDTGKWVENDPLNVITLVNNNSQAVGALNVVQSGSPGVYTPQVNATYVQAVNGLELGGGLNLQHGQFVFNDANNGLLGCIFPSAIFLPGNVLAGFTVTGQAAQGPYTVTSVQNYANQNLVYLTTSSPNTIQPGNVLQTSSFTNATFLNGQKFCVQSISTAVVGGITVYTIVCQGLTTYSTAYGPTTDSGQITLVKNDVLVTASGAGGVVIQPILSGALVGPQVITQPNHQYVLQTWIGAGAKTRYTRPYRNMTQTATYGNQAVAASGTISWVITDVNLGVYVIEQQNPLFGLFPAAPAPVVTKYTVKNAVLPPFALYCLLNGINLNVSINYTLISSPPQGLLTVQSLTGASGGSLPWLPNQLSVPIHYQLGFGMINQTAQISQSGEVNELSFYTDSIPSVGARIRFQSWSAGQSVSRVQDTIAIASEAAVSGDNGVRSAIMTNLSPPPRTSDECEAAAAAAILDREYPQFQGTYSIVTVPLKYENLYSAATSPYPQSGRYLFINALSRGVSGQNFFANTVRIQVIELRQEVMTISIDYGPDLFLEKMLPSFLERDQNLLTPIQTVAPPNPITLPQVLNAFLPTLDNAQVISVNNSLSGNFILIDLGAPPVTACEVRSVDNGWGVANAGRVGLFTTQQFTVPRTSLDQTWYLRTLNGAKFSRWSKALRVVYPLIPSSPALVSSNASRIVAGLQGDVRNIYGLELRASGGNIFFQPNNPAPFQELQFLERGTFRVGAQVGLWDTPGFGNAGPTWSQQGQGFNITDEAYGPPNDPNNPNYNIIYQDGDVVFVSCPVDGSFDGLYTNFLRRLPPLSNVPNPGFITPGSYIFANDYNKTDNLLQTIGIGNNFGTPVGTTQLYYRPPFVVYAQALTLASGGIVTVATVGANPLVAGQAICCSVGWSQKSPPVYPPGAIPQNSTPISQVQVVNNVIDSSHFTIQLPLSDPWYNGSYTGGTLNRYFVSGAISPLPNNFLTLAKGTILQRTVTAPSDLVIDLTNPDIANVLSFLASQSTANRVGGLELFFFNLTWDYSAPTIVPTFQVPSLTGAFVDIQSQTLQWSVQQGFPDGHRIVTYHPSTGLAQSRFTIDHPNNPVTLKRANMPAPDWTNARVITITPFDALGDGIPTTINWLGSSGIAPNTSGLPLAFPGDTIRYNIYGDGAWDSVIAAQCFGGVYQVAFGAAVAVGFAAGFATSAGMVVADIQPTRTRMYGRSYSNNAIANANAFGMILGQDANGSVNFPFLASYRTSFMCAPTVINNNERMWFGLGNFTNASANGTNGTAILGTTKYATDTPNSTTVGFRYSGGVDTNWQVVVIIAGGAVTILDSGVPVTTTPHLFEFVPAADGNSITFFIDGQIVQVVSSNLPPLLATRENFGDLFIVQDNKNNAFASGFSFWYMESTPKYQP